jgi:hypothetical protein
MHDTVDEASRPRRVAAAEHRAPRADAFGPVVGY